LDAIRLKNCISYSKFGIEYYSQYTEKANIIFRLKSIRICNSYKWIKIISGLKSIHFQHSWINISENLNPFHISIHFAGLLTPINRFTITSEISANEMFKAGFTLIASQSQVCYEIQSEACILKSILHIGCRNKFVIGL